MTNSTLHLYTLMLDLDPNEEHAAEAAVERWAQMISQPPLAIKCDVRPLPGPSRLQVLQELEADPEVQVCMTYVFGYMAEQFGQQDGISSKLAIFCPREHWLSGWIRRTEPMADWGACFGHVSVTYEFSSPQITWHELLHLLGASDCYGEDTTIEPGPTCDEPRCVMQYVPTPESVGEQLRLCQDNVRRIMESLDLTRDRC